MRPTFMGFETATRSLMASQKALDIVNNNIGNIGVTGYTRQRVDMVSMSLNNRYARYATNTVGLAGQGAMVNGVSQIRDTFLDKRFREEYADVGYYGKTTDILTDIGNALDEIEPSNMTTALEKFKSAWNTLQNENGTDAVAVNSLLSSARSLTQAFKQMDTKLNNVWEQQKFDLEVDVNSLNSIFERVANLNDAIQKEVFNSSKPGNAYYAPNELYDARNVLLDELSKYGNIAVKQNADGTVDVTMGADDHPVVTGNKFDTLIVQENQRDQTVAVKWRASGQNADMRTGSLKAFNDMLNGRGTVAKAENGENFEKGILYYKDKVDAFAKTFAESFNNIIEVVDPATNTPIRGEYKQLFTFTGDGDFKAGNIDISTDWSNDASYIIKDIHQVGGKQDTSFVAKALAKFGETLDFGEFKGTFNGYVMFYSNANLANQHQFSESRLTACSDVADSVLNRISEISGVSMEEEGVDMMQYTKAFQAMSRVMTAMDEALDVLINKTGLVGR